MLSRDELLQVQDLFKTKYLSDAAYCRAVQTLRRTTVRQENETFAEYTSRLMTNEREHGIECALPLDRVNVSDSHIPVRDIAHCYVNGSANRVRKKLVDLVERMRSFSTVLTFDTAGSAGMDLFFLELGQVVHPRCSYLSLWMESHNTHLNIINAADILSR